MVYSLPCVTSFLTCNEIFVENVVFSSNLYSPNITR